ncbi:hypothetical protein SLS60_004872 [Paraconiothyrium brasiliense]|uniref:Uncharacterized protein n=1 Tax=Paraconiothyrium brasiliense TaxID=300254 RepID=A0ABR3RMG5_9PLEO
MRACTLRSVAMNRYRLIDSRSIAYIAQTQPAGSSYTLAVTSKIQDPASPTLTLLIDGTEGHTCKIDDNDQKFKEIVDEKGYKECYVCGATVELAEDWNGIHGCPQYGPAHYDEEGYNQDGYHRDTGLNRDGRTRHEQANHIRGEDEDDEDADENEEQVEDMWRQILSHLDPDRRLMLESLDPEEREDVLMQLQIEFIEQGIVFDIPQPPAPPQQDRNSEDEDEDEDENEQDGEGEGDTEDEDRGESDDRVENEDDDDAQQDDQLLNAEVIQGADHNAGDEHANLGFGHNAAIADELPPMAGSWVDSDTPSPHDFSHATNSNSESSVASPKDLAELSDQE